MATIKMCTDISQSKKLAEILPLESADCFWDYDEMQMFHRISWFEDGYNKESQLMLSENNVCAWSLAALLDVLPNNKHISTNLSRGGWKIEPVEYIDKWFCEYEDEDSPCRDFTVSADNPVDACYEVIIKLYELKML